jgi:hypothetical protein
MPETTAEFKEYGDVAQLTSREADPVAACLASTKYNVDPTNPLRYQIGLCETWMAQRCSRGWDKYCEVYLSDQINKDFTGKAANKWLREALESRFCRVDQNSPGSYCYEKCDLFDPISSQGAQVCRTFGDVVYRDSNKLYNIDTNYNWSNKLTAPSPIKFKTCDKVCDVFTLSDFKEDDRILNECLDRGIGLDILQNLAQNLVSNNVPIQNSRLRSFIKRYIIESTTNEITPGFSSIGQAPVITTIPIATPAINPYLPPNSHFSVQSVDNNPSEPSKYQIDYPQEQTSYSDKSRTTRVKKIRPQPVRMHNTEEYKFLPPRIGKGIEHIIIIILVIALIIVVRTECIKK